MADLVLPAICFVEHDDLYRNYGQTFLQVADKIIDAPGECRPNHQLICELGQRLGSDYRGFCMSEKELIAETLERSGYPPASEFTQQHFLDCALEYEEAHFLNGFEWPDKKFRFMPDWASIGPLGVDWIGINLLISAEPAAPNGGAVFHDTAVWVEPV